MKTNALYYGDSNKWEEMIMDTRSLIIFAIGAVMIAVGLPLFYVGRYLSAPEDKKKQKARGLKIIGIVWMAVGVLIYICVLVFRVFKLI
jgi:heme/copper-type cytochrome/quinol oxidase subunit 2